MLALKARANALSPLVEELARIKVDVVAVSADSAQPLTAHIEKLDGNLYVPPCA